MLVRNAGSEIPATVVRSSPPPCAHMNFARSPSAPVTTCRKRPPFLRQRNPRRNLPRVPSLAGPIRKDQNGTPAPHFLTVPWLLVVVMRRISWLTIAIAAASAAPITTLGEKKKQPHVKKQKDEEEQSRKQWNADTLTDAIARSTQLALPNDANDDAADVDVSEPETDAAGEEGKKMKKAKKAKAKASASPSPHPTPGTKGRASASPFPHPHPHGHNADASEPETDVAGEEGKKAKKAKAKASASPSPHPTKRRASASPSPHPHPHGDKAKASARAPVSSSPLSKSGTKSGKSKHRGHEHDEHVEHEEHEEQEAHEEGKAQAEDEKPQKHEERAAVSKGEARKIEAKSEPEKPKASQEAARKLGDLVPAFDAVCEDQAVSGFRSEDGSVEYSCSELEPLCNQKEFGEGVKAACPLTCGVCQPEGKVKQASKPLKARKQQDNGKPITHHEKPSASAQAREPKAAEREPKAAEREPKAAEREPKQAAEREPKQHGGVRKASTLQQALLPQESAEEDTWARDRMEAEPEIQEIIAKARQDPALAQSLLEDLAKSNPMLAQLVNEHQADFMALLNGPGAAKRQSQRHRQSST